MAPVSSSLFSRNETVQAPSTGLSATLIAGISLAGAAALTLLIILIIVYLRKRTKANAETGEKVPRTMQLHQREPLSADLQALRPSAGLTRSVSRKNITNSIVLPTPMPPIPAARLQLSRLALSREPAVSIPKMTPVATHSPGRSSSLSSSLSSAADIIAHHTATGTMPRAFTPILAPALSEKQAEAAGVGAGAAPAANGPFSFALNAASSPTRPTFDFTLSAAPQPPSPIHEDPTTAGGTPRPRSTLSFSRLSILSASLRGSSSFGNNSISSLSSVGTPTAGGGETRKVHHVFAPLLPDELVLRPREKVTLIQSFDDGWCVVGRKSPFAAAALAKQPHFAFGQSKQHADEIEIGVVPLWVFDKRTAASRNGERPMRSSSLGITLVLNEGERPSPDVREDVISWSNF